MTVLPDEWLMVCWKDLMDDAGQSRMGYLKGAIDALWMCGQMDIYRRELWMLRIEKCPENTPTDPGHIGGRGWCAYCGDIPQDSLV